MCKITLNSVVMLINKRFDLFKIEFKQLLSNCMADLTQIPLTFLYLGCPGHSFYVVLFHTDTLCYFNSRFEISDLLNRVYIYKFNN